MATSLLLVTVAAVAQDARVVLGVLVGAIAVGMLHARAGWRRAEGRLRAHRALEALEPGPVDSESAGAVELPPADATHSGEAEAPGWRVDKNDAQASAEGQFGADVAGSSASEPPGAGKGTSVRVRRRRNRARPPEPVAASWVQVAPGRFVRVEDSDRAAPPAGADASADGDTADTALNNPPDGPRQGAE